MFNSTKQLRSNLKSWQLFESHVDKIVALKDRYTSVGDPLNIPWYFIAAIHTMESSRKFSTHLHNGDPLSKRTTHVPADRPKTGHPPFTWEESAMDALKMKDLHKIDDWSIARFLYAMEGYNGWGYRLYHQHVLSPYLWSYTNHYHSGKYIADGTWSDTAVSRQAGAIPIIRRMEQRGIIDPLVVTSVPNKVIFKHSKKKVERADDLQRFLNTFDGNSLLVDGWPGDKTSDAVKRVFGFYLQGDPRP